MTDTIRMFQGEDKSSEKNNVTEDIKGNEKEGGSFLEGNEGGVKASYRCRIFTYQSLIVVRLHTLKILQYAVPSTF